MSNNEEIIAFWLLPAEKEGEFLSSLIRHLAVRFDAPIFAPHVTLYAGAMSTDRAAKILATLNAPSGLRLEMESVAFSEEFTKTLFVQFRPSAEAEEFSREIAAATGSESGYRFDPHLSLVYGTISEAEKVAQAIEMPFESVIFDALRTIVCPARIKERGDVEVWRTLEERRL